MSRRARSRVLPVGLCLFAFFIAASGAVLAEEPAKLSPLDKEMEGIRKLISNADMKLRRGVARMAPRGGKSGIQTPGALCCGDNVERINQSLEKVRAMVRDVGTCFEQNWDRSGTEAVTLVAHDLRALAAGIQAFVDAPSRRDTSGALGGTQRAYLNLKRRLDALPSCSTGAPAPKK